MVMEALLETLASPRRRAILRLVWHRERAAGEIHRALGDVTFGAVSQQLKKLTDAGLTECRRDGKRRLYRAKKEAFGVLAAELEAMWDDALGRLQDLAEESERSERRTKKQ